MVEIKQRLEIMNKVLAEVRQLILDGQYLTAFDLLVTSSEDAEIYRRWASMLQSIVRKQAELSVLLTFCKQISLRPMHNYRVKLDIEKEMDDLQKEYTKELREFFGEMQDWFEEQMKFN